MVIKYGIPPLFATVFGSVLCVWQVTVIRRRKERLAEEGRVGKCNLGTHIDAHGDETSLVASCELDCFFKYCSVFSRKGNVGMANVWSAGWTLTGPVAYWLVPHGDEMGTFHSPPSQPHISGPLIILIFSVGASVWLCCILLCVLCPVAEKYRVCKQPCVCLLMNIM